MIRRQSADTFLYHHGGGADGLKVKTERLSHQGTFGVGYGVCTYEVTGRDPQRYFLEQYRGAQKGRRNRGRLRKIRMYGLPERQ